MNACVNGVRNIIGRFTTFGVLGHCHVLTHLGIGVLNMTINGYSVRQTLRSCLVVLSTIGQRTLGGVLQDINFRIITNTTYTIAMRRTGTMSTIGKGLCLVNGFITLLSRLGDITTKRMRNKDVIFKIYCNGTLRYHFFHLMNRVMKQYREISYLYFNNFNCYCVRHINVLNIISSSLGITICGLGSAIGCRKNFTCHTYVTIVKHLFRYCVGGLLTLRCT